jgi:hypothetical protein
MVFGLAFAPDGPALATGGFSDGVRLWEAASFDEMAAAQAAQRAEAAPGGAGAAQNRQRLKAGGCVAISTWPASLPLTCAALTCISPNEGHSTTRCHSAQSEALARRRDA